MALNNPYGAPSMLSNKVYVDLLDKAMDVIWDRGDRVPSRLGDFFHKFTAKTDSFKLSNVDSVVDLPVRSEDGGIMPYTQPAPGFDKTYTTVEYRRFIRVQRKMVEMDLSGKIRAMMSGLPKSAKRLLEYAYADIFNNGFGTTATPDGAYLFSASHLLEDGAAGTADNLEASSAFSHSTFSTARVNMRKTKNSKGFVDPVVPRVVLIPPDLEEEAHRILKSEKVENLSINAANWNEGVVMPVVSEWLTSTTAWFLIGDREGEAKGLCYIERVAPGLMDVQYEDPDIIWGKRLRMDFTVGAHDWRNVSGSAGA